MGATTEDRPDGPATAYCKMNRTTSHTLFVSLVLPGAAEAVDMELSGDVPLAELLPALVAALGLPPGDYWLAARAGPLDPQETLLSAGVLRGQVLTLQHADQEPAPPHPPDPPAAPPHIRLADLVGARPALRSGTTLAFWSGPAGGSGRTTLALTVAVLAAERRLDALLLALAEPSVSAYLRLPRTPNATAFFETGDLDAAEQAVTWDGAGSRRLRVLLGPARPRDGRVPPERVAALLDAARLAAPLLLLDLPTLTAGENPWVLEPLVRADALALVVPPTVTGVAAAVEALATLRDLAAPARVHLALIRRAPGGLPAREFTAAVRELWGDCPPLAAEAPFTPGLPARLDCGELVEAVLAPAKGEELWLQAARTLLAIVLPSSPEP